MVLTKRIVVRGLLRREWENELQPRPNGLAENALGTRLNPVSVACPVLTPLTVALCTEGLCVICNIKKCRVTKNIYLTL